MSSANIPRVFAAAAAAAAAKSLQSCPTLCDPTDGSPLGSSVPGFSRQEYWSALPLPFPPECLLGANTMLCTTHSFNLQS